MKKLSFIFLLTLLPLMASAYDAQIGGIYYDFDTDSQQATVVYGTTKYAGKVTIPATVVYNGVSYSVTSIGDKAFLNCSGLTSITIPNCVTSIGGSVFSGCYSLTSVTIPNSVTSIGDGAFYNCSGLTSVEISNSMTLIGNRAFQSCTSLTSVTIPNSVKTLGQYTFLGCSSMTTVIIGSGVTSIGAGALGECFSLAEVYCYGMVLPTMGNSVFYNIKIADATLYVPSASINAYKNADPWMGFGAIKEIPGYIPDTPEASVIYYDFDENSKQATVISGDTKYYGTVTIPETVVHNGVTYTVTAIGNNAFYGCNSLISVTIPNSVKTLGQDAFLGCSGLTSMEIPNSVTSIREYCFYGCAGLTSITIPNSVISIGSGIFSKCTALNSIIVENGNAKYDSRDNCNAIIETATNTLITGCKGTVIPNSVTSIGSYAFSDCSSLTSVIIPNSVTDLGEFAFYNCSGLRSVTISERITTIKGYTFEGCSNLTSVIIPNSVKTIGIDAFYKCTSLSSVTFGNSVEVIGFCSFWGCSSLTSVTIPNSVTSISERAFYGCKGLKTVTIPYSVTQIGKSSFANCYDLTDVYCYARAVPSTNIEAFNNTTIANVTLHVPTESVTAYQTTEPWSGFGNFVAMDVEPEPLKKCATPTISFVNGKLEFDCETEGVEYVFTAIPPSEISGSGNDIFLSTKYVVAVYAKKEGYENSEVTTKEIEAGGFVGKKGDVNEDDKVNGTDIQEVINIIVNAE